MWILRPSNYEAIKDWWYVERLLYPTRIARALNKELPIIDNGYAVLGG